MAITATEIRQMQREIETLKKKVARLEKRENGKRHAHTPVARAKKISERERVRAILRNAGVLAELTPEEKAMAAEWRALPQARKEFIIQKLRTTQFNPPLSETVMQDRD
ncbi:MAG: hypothetical protein HZC40_22500 [Chloroflexi bacterium]|nr:hypothetical protein [Chloroflexota bacterium]